MTRRTEIGVMVMTIGRVLVGTPPAASLQISAEIESVKSKNSAMKGTMITMVRTTINLTGSGH
jgi:hypothetical protein